MTPRPDRDAPKDSTDVRDGRLSYLLGKEGRSRRMRRNGGTDPTETGDDGEMTNGPCNPSNLVPGKFPIKEKQ